MILSIILIVAITTIIFAIWFISDSLKKKKHTWANIMIIALGFFLIATLNFLTQIF